MKLSFHNRRPRSKPALNYSADEPPLRSELFSADQMREHGKTLASSHKSSSEPDTNPLVSCVLTCLNPWLAEARRARN